MSWIPFTLSLASPNVRHLDASSSAPDPETDTSAVREIACRHPCVRRMLEKAGPANRVDASQLAFRDRLTASGELMSVAEKSAGRSNRLRRTGLQPRMWACLRLRLVARWTAGIVLRTCRRR